jgi:galactokinase
MSTTAADRHALLELGRLARESGLDVVGGTVRRSSSRFCLGVEHGDYNGTELFGVGTDRFIWLAAKANDTGRIRLFSGNFPDDGVIEFQPGETPEPQSLEIADTWGRFPFGVDHVLNREGFSLSRGADIVIHGNIPGGGMSRSASLSLNLILSLAELNEIVIADDPMRVALMAQAVENDYIGSPCGLLDQVMILFAREGMGTHYRPGDRSVSHVPLGAEALDFRLISLDTGTVRPGLEKSTYATRRAECDEFVSMLEASFGISTLAEIRSRGLYRQILNRYDESHPHLCDRLSYIFDAQSRFTAMLEAWRIGDITTVGRVFRADGLGLRDLYRISGPELETMCDIARSVPGVLGERMLGGGDKGAAGAIVRSESVDALRSAVETGYPRSHPSFAEAFAVHVLSMVDGMTTLEATLGSEQ